MFNFLFLGINLGRLLVDLLAVILFHQRFLRVRIILHLCLVQFPLQQVQLLLRLRDLFAQISEAFAPFLLVILVLCCRIGFPRGAGLGVFRCALGGLLSRRCGALVRCAASSAAQIIFRIDLFWLRFFLLLFTCFPRRVGHRVAGGLLFGSLSPCKHR